MLNHVGFIMDGNRRWAKDRFLPSFAGHKAGADNVKKILKLSKQKQIKYVTLWALSTENIKSRSTDELTYLYGLIEKLPDFLQEMLSDGMRFETIGDLDLLPEKTRNILNKVKEDTKNNSDITFILAVAYGGRNEIIRGIKKFIKEGGNIETLDEKSFLNYLDTGAFPEPDLLVRTGGDVRLSGFMQYVSDYSEYYFTDKKWPEFDEVEFDKAIEKFYSTKRNFGK